MNTKGKSKKRRVSFPFDKGRAKLLKRIEKSPSFSNYQIIQVPPSKEKMSEVILDFLEPIINLCEAEENLDKAVGFGILVWNASLLPRKQRRETIEEFTKAWGFENQEMRSDFKYFFKFLLKRKKRYFSENKRIIVDYQFSRVGKKLMLYVVSTPFFK